VKHSRRDLTLLLPALAVAKASGQNAPAQKAPVAPKPVLPSKTYRFEDLPVRTNTKNSNTQRAVFNGKTHKEVPVELHITELGPGEAPHPPHHHVHEEMIMIHEGTLEVTIAGNTSKLGPGSVAFVASNEEHGWRNVGTTRAQYFVLAVGQEPVA
jgi:quercetin dioxygenase-like cupin family protein